MEGEFHRLYVADYCLMDQEARWLAGKNQAPVTLLGSMWWILTRLLSNPSNHPLRGVKKKCNQAGQCYFYGKSMKMDVLCLIIIEPQSLAPCWKVLWRCHNHGGSIFKQHMWLQKLLGKRKPRKRWRGGREVGVYVGGLSFIITEEELLRGTAANRHVAFPPHAEFTL